MTRTLSISETGLRLIKAFEGFRSEDRTLASGVRVVGYGHVVQTVDEPLRLSRVEAEDILLDDLAPIELVVNEDVHAPLSQGQYDALCSLAFNIGVEAFQTSDIVRALNNGRVLDAANGFDVWRKATVQGKTYVVDALMRRRTAEKSLFLRSEPAVPAPSAILVPQRDGTAPLGPTDDGLPRVTEGSGVLDGEALVLPETAADAEIAAEIELPETVQEVEEAAPVALELDLPTATSGLTDLATSLDDMDFEAALSGEIADDPSVKLIDPAAPEIAVPDLPELEDAPSADVPLVVAEGTPEDTTENTPEEEDTPEEIAAPVRSSIADAADALGDRLDALLDTEDAADARSLSDALPDSLVTVETDDAEVTLLASDIAVTEDTPRSNLVSFPTKERVLVEPEELPELPEVGLAEDLAEDTVRIDSLDEDDIIRSNKNPDAEIAVTEEDPVENALRYIERQSAKAEKKGPGGGFWIPVAIGALLVGASAALMGQGATRLLSSWGPIAVVAAAITGGLLLLFAFYIFMRSRFAR
jgi:lysozyme